MKKAKIQSKPDRLSELPDSLIIHILGFLGMRDVVGTTILSKRWKNLWTTADCLNFDDLTMISADKVRDFINQAIKSWRGIKIKKFTIAFAHIHLEKSLTSDIDSWVRFAVEKGVQELCLNFRYRDSTIDHVLYKVPQCLFSCSSLQILFLKSCELRIEGNVQWDQLGTLKIEGEDVGEDTIEKVLAGSPRLLFLDLNLRDSSRSLSIESSSLEYLFIDKYLFYDNDAPSTATELRISTPKLRGLRIMGVPYKKICFVRDVPYLGYVTLNFYGPRIYWDELFGGNEFLVETLRGILPTFQHVAEFTLSEWCTKALGDARRKYRAAPYWDAKFLRINGSFKEYEEIVDLLQTFPKLQTLVLALEKGTTYREKAEKSERNLPESFLLELRTVDVTWTSKGDEWILPLIEILLKYGSKLEKVVFRGRRRVAHTQWKSSFMASQELLRMERSSPNCRVEFL